MKSHDLFEDRTSKKELLREVIAVLAIHLEHSDGPKSLSQGALGQLAVVLQVLVVMHPISNLRQSHERLVRYRRMVARLVPVVPALLVLLAHVALRDAARGRGAVGAELLLIVCLAVYVLDF